MKISKIVEKYLINENKSMIDKLKKEWGKIDKIDPESPTYKKLTKYLDSLDQKTLKSLVDANIKFVSKLAMNRLKKEK